MNSEDMLDQKIPVGDNTNQNIEFLKIRANLIISGLDMATEIKRNTK